MAHAHTKGLPKIIVIVGPTASGKTALAHTIAKRFSGDIITADSRQVYRGANIGTAKPHPRRGARGAKHWFYCPDIKNVRHYSIDLVEPWQYFSVQQWKQMCEDAIREITLRGRVPIIEGGTWLWVWSVTKNLTIPKVPPDKKLRERLEKRIQKGELENLVHTLLKKDPALASFLDMKNPRRVIRAWEVMRHAHARFSELRSSQPPKYNILMLGIRPSDKTLEKNITQRLRQQLRKGLYKEFQRLERLWGHHAPALSGIGYREWKSPNSKKTAPQLIIRDTKKLAKTQLRMFRRDPAVTWERTRPGTLKRVRLFFKGPRTK